MLLKNWKVSLSWRLEVLNTTLRVDAGVFENKSVLTRLPNFQRHFLVGNVPQINLIKLWVTRSQAHIFCNGKETTRRSTCCRYSWKYRTSSFVSWAVREDQFRHVLLK